MKNACSTTTRFWRRRRRKWKQWQILTISRIFWEEWYIPRVSLHFHRCRNINFDSSLLFCPYNSRTNTQYHSPLFYNKSNPQTHSLLLINAHFLIILPMRVSNSRINKEEQVKVVVRLKPESNQSRYSKYVYLCDHDERQLVVETGSKKEIFMFDHIAHELTSQQEIYKMIGEECVKQAFDGYNCCIFAYGQTGAGKTFSVLGNLSDLQSDPYSQSRGILPRVLQNVFELAGSRQEGEKVKVTCAYMQIYNEQIFDLLSYDKRIHQIREDKKGVFVQGLIERKIMTYRSAIGLLLQGQKTRKMASTQMNTQSSRSHAIFSILIESEIIQNQTITTKKAKLHIVDLAGSERVKHTNVEGERLREGCNINRSLHVLGNVINCLAESNKKKKHIPFRDSKLTHYLKDSLGGNSITKLLANIHTGRQYFGDTLSTLMFAKRAKLLKMKVQLNETTAQNFDSLRKQIRKLREELAQARYFKGSERTSFEENDISAEKITPPQHLQIEVSPTKNETSLMLEENQIHFKALIEIYQEHMKTCLGSSQVQRKQNINIVKEWKNLEKRNISLTHLVKQLPLFTKIYKENLLLRQERFTRTQPLFDRANDKTIQNNSYVDQKKQQRRQVSVIDKEELSKVIEFYENLINEIQERFTLSLQALEKSYLQVQNECKIKQKKIKDLRQKWQVPPDIEQLRNQNQYLHLSILNLENQIQKLQEKEQKLKLQLKESKRSTAKKESRQETNDEEQNEQIIANILQQLQQIKREAEKESAQVDIERAEMQMVIQKLQAQINKYMVQNQRLRQKYSRSKSKHKRRSQSKRLDEVQSVKHTLATPQPKQCIKSEAKYMANSALSVSGFEDHRNYTKEILTLKMDIKRKQKEITDLKKELDEYVSGDKKIEEEFGKNLEQVIEEYRNLRERRTLHQSKSVKNIYSNMHEQGRRGRQGLKYQEYRRDNKYQDYRRDKVRNNLK